ncbi:hypothetical protein ACC677_36865, partial [Rhizobium ruizarguesonis]
MEVKAAYRKKAKTGGDAAQAQDTRAPAAGFAVAAQRRMQVRSNTPQPPTETADQAADGMPRADPRSGANV